MRCSEIHLVSLSLVDVAHHYEESATLHHKVGIDIDERIIAYLRLHFIILLHCESAHLRAVFWCIIRGKICHIGSKVALEYLCNLEVKIDIAPDIEVRNRQNGLLAAVLISHPVLPIQCSEGEILTELGCDKADILG